MKKITLLILLFIPFIGFSQNIVVNPNFDGLGAEWDLFNMRDGSGVVDPADSHTADGSSSYLMVSNGTNTTHIRQKFFKNKLEAADYTFGFWVKGANGTIVRPVVYDHENIDGADYEIKVTDTWEYVEDTFTIIADAAISIRPYLITLGVSVQIDDVVFGKVGTLSTKDNKLTSFSIYPNPTTDKLNVQSQDQNSIDRIAVYNMLGQQIKSITVGKRATQIDVADLSQGIYVLKVETDLGNAVSRFVKE